MGHRSSCRWLAAGVRVRRRALALVSAVSAGGALLGTVLGSPAGAAVPAPPPSPPLAAQVNLQAASRPIPASYLGVSIEYSQLGIYDRAGAALDNVFAQVKPQNGAPMLLRIGGKSADHALWESSLAGEPKSAFEVGPPWVDQLNDLVRRDRLRVMLDLNLAVHSPKLAVAEAEAVRAALPRGRLAGLEIGNEPDLYWRQTDLDRERVLSTPGSIARLWSRDYSAADYRRDYYAYARALVAGVPGIALGGPEIISARPEWLASMEGLGRATPHFLSVHRYASSTCWPRSSPWYPTIALMLNETSSAGLGASVQQAAAYAHSHGQSLRLTEVNSISCGGNHGVADSFATALWAPDALFELLRAGTDSVSFHIRPTAVNAPFHFTPQGIEAMPELYGLAVFADMTRPGARLVATSLREQLGLHLKAWAVRYRGGMRVLLIDKGARWASVTLNLGAAGRAFVRLLRAPRVWSSTGVTFGGQSIGPDGRWQGQLQATPVNGSGGLYRVQVPPFSAALVSAR